MPHSACFGLDPSLVFLNHGSFGATPLEVQARRRAIEDLLERDPVHFFLRLLEPMLDEARERLARFVGANPSDLAFVPNATTGVNAVLCWFPWRPGDELLVTDHGYAACSHAGRVWTGRAGATVRTVALPFPCRDEDELLDALLAGVTPNTRLVLVDHVTSPTALVLPVARISRALAARGVQVLVDGAHGPGLVDLDLDALQADYYVANLHKWCLAPKGAAFLWVHPRHAGKVRPTVLSHGAGSTRTDRSRFHLEFDWTGTHDPSAVLAAPAALDFLESLVPGGAAALRARNRAVCLAGRERLAERLGVELPAPASLVAAMASLPLPPGPPRTPAPPPGGLDPLTDWLYHRHRIVAPVIAFPASPARLVRVTAHLYNEPDHYERLADALLEGLAEERRGAAR